jgi:hypothetical protein
MLHLDAAALYVTIAYTECGWLYIQQARPPIGAPPGWRMVQRHWGAHGAVASSEVQDGLSITETASVIPVRPSGAPIHGTKIMNMQGLMLVHIILAARCNRGAVGDRPR